MIQISAQHGDPKTPPIIRLCHKTFNDLFEEKMSAKYFSTVTILSIIFRVSGKITDFGGEGPERLRYVKKENEITIDLVIPEDKWRGVEPETIKHYIGDGVATCFDLLIAKAEATGEIDDPRIIKRDFDEVMAEFRAAEL